MTERKCPVWVRQTMTERNGAQVDVMAPCAGEVLPTGRHCRSHANKRDY